MANALSRFAGLTAKSLLSATVTGSGQLLALETGRPITDGLFYVGSVMPTSAHNDTFKDAWWGGPILLDSSNRFALLFRAQKGGATHAYVQNFSGTPDMSLAVKVVKLLV